MAFPALDLGAIPQREKGTTSFRVWAPARRRVELVISRGAEIDRVPLEAQPQGYFSTELPVAPGTRYRYRLDGSLERPDPCSRFQPEGPHGASEVIDARAYAWSDGGWRGVERKGLVLYELHLGTFSPQGTWAGAGERLEYLRDLGVTCIQVMPVNTFPGRFNWGYDGVDLFAPCAVYGRPDDMRRFVDRAHALGLGVILDVVYNHLGPNGNYLRDFTPLYFTDAYPPEWGEPLRFEGKEALPVREMVVQNAVHWVCEYHVDGLRIDATQNLYDDPDNHILADIVVAARAAAGDRSIFIACESECQNERITRSAGRGGYGADAVVIDDFHHTCRVAATGSGEAYLGDYRGTARELLACALHNAIFQGQWYGWQNKRRGSHFFDRSAESVIFFLQNHDQVANTTDGRRLHTDAGPRVMRALTVLLLCAPQTPLLFQGQELFSSSPFSYFTDHPSDLQAAVARGRSEFMAQFPTIACAQREAGALDIGEHAFARAKLDWRELEGPLQRGALGLHRALLRLRKEEPALAAQDRARISGATLSEQALVVRYFCDEADVLLLLNLGSDLLLSAISEPLLAPPAGAEWSPLLHSEETRFFGQGARYPAGDGPWSIPGKCACVMRAQAVSAAPGK